MTLGKSNSNLKFYQQKTINIGTNETIVDDLEKEGYYIRPINGISHKSSS